MKEPLLLLPGMMCDGRLFAPQIEAFSARRTIVIAPQVGRKTISEMAQDILASAPPTFALAGLSMGGITAMEMIRQAPQRISRLALMDTNPLAETKERAMERDGQIRRVRNGKLRSVMRDEMKPNYLSDGPNTGRILDLCMAMSDTLGVNVFVEQSRALQTRADQTQTLRSIEVPTLVLCGEDDTLCPVTHHQLMHQHIPGSRLCVISAAGHMPVLEQPTQTNAELQCWLDA